MRPLDISGQRYGRLTAVKRVALTDRHTKWLFNCDCGQETVVHLDAVRAGATRSCGCLRREDIAVRSTTHGHKRGRRSTRTHRAWQHAKSRCLNPNDEKFPIYGGRGIRVCERWSNSFESFLADMGECPADHSIDRIDPDKGYEPSNCRWATTKQQARTRTDNVLVEFGGRRLILKDFAAEMGVNYKRLHNRMRHHGDTPIQAAQRLRRRAA